MEEIMVSVFCTVYNHEKYIKDTLEGFVKQKTQFKYEVLINDDCSTDKSAQIIQSYAEKYPDIIKPIFQRENQYQQGINILKKFLLPLAKGKYIAMCEGDDYWISNNKLQKQVEYMEENPKCTFCFTNGIIKNNIKASERIFIPYKKQDAKYITENGNYDLEMINKLSFLPTCSFLFPKKNYELFPEAYWRKSFGNDRKITLYSTALGYAHFIDEATCCYNYGVPNSLLTKDKTKLEIAKIERTYIDFYNDINEFTNYAYDKIITEYNLNEYKLIYFLDKNKLILSEKEIEMISNTLCTMDKIKKRCFDCMSDKMFNMLRKLKRKLGIM